MTMRKTIGRLLRRWAARVDPPSDDDEDYCVGCESCNASIDIDEAIRSGDCYVCLSCHEAWRAEAAKCEHRWDKASNEYGDDGYCCHRCGMWTDADPLPVIGFEKVKAITP